MSKQSSLRVISTILYIITGIVFLYCSVLLLSNGTLTGKKVMLLTVAAVSLPLFFATLLRGKSETELAQKQRVIRLSVTVLLGYYCIALVGILFLGARGSDMGSISLVPFKSIMGFVEQLVTGDFVRTLTVVIDNLLGNFVMFMPMAVFLPCLFPGQRRWLVFLASIAGIIVVVELMQYVTGSGMCDIDDFILNFTGAVIAYAFIRLPFMHKFLVRVHIMGD